MKTGPRSLCCLKTAILCLIPAVPCGLSGAIDSGGGSSVIGAYRNHASIGEPFETASGTAGDYMVYRGLIEVLYPPLTVDPEEDSDGNGLPDWWEMDHFGYIGVDPDNDADRDGSANGMEFLAKTDPNDPLSVFRPACHRDGDALVVPVQTQSGRTYHIWGSPDLDTWSHLESLDGDGTLVEWHYLLSDPADLPYFLRIEIVLP